jgi:hypothetical protein
MNTILFVYSGKPGTRDKLAEIENCLKQASSPEMNAGNFEWVIGSDLRKAWAEDKLDSSVLAADHLAEEEYGYYHDIMYADAWCEAANSLSKLASHDSSGDRIDQQEWANIAFGYLTEANKTEHASERQSRINTAKASFGNGKYGAAIFDAVYVLAMDQADIEMANMTEDELINRTGSLLANGYSSAWANIYASQAAYLANKDIPDCKSAYPLLRFASSLDDAISEMNAANAAGKGKNNASAADSALFPYTTFAVVLLATFIFLFMVFFFIILPRIRKRMPDERKDSKTDRTDRRTRKRIA